MCDDDLDYYKDDADYNYGPEKDAHDFDDLGQVYQDDLEEWLNCEPDEEDKERLFKLYTSGEFRAWDCPECNTRVYEGRPGNWRHFQGSNNQDFSYFGNLDKYTQKYISALCDNCRLTL